MIRLLLSLCFALFCGSPLIAAARQESAQVHILSAGSLQTGEYRLALVIDLAPGLMTYWRDPGGSGLPPQLQSLQSKNLADFNLLFPAPQRYATAHLEDYGYRGRVVLPLSIRPVQAEEAVDIDLHFDYGACEKICMPGQADFHLHLTPDATASVDAAAIDQAFADLPAVLSPTEQARIHISAAAQQHWRIEFPVDRSPRDLFPEAGEGWIFTTKRIDQQSFDLQLVDKPNQGGEVLVRLTASGEKPFEFSQNFKLDAGQ